MCSVVQSHSAPNWRRIAEGETRLIHPSRATRPAAPSGLPGFAWPRRCLAGCGVSWAAVSRGLRWVNSANAGGNLVTQASFETSLEVRFAMGET